MSSARRNVSFRFTSREVSVKHPARIRTQTQRITVNTSKEKNGCLAIRSVLPKTREISMPRNGESVWEVNTTMDEVRSAKRLLTMIIFRTGTTWGRFCIVVTGCHTYARIGRRSLENDGKIERAFVMKAENVKRCPPVDWFQTCLVFGSFFPFAF